MTADKPEAGRTCAYWCGTLASDRDARDSFSVIGQGLSYCSRACAEAGRPLNPAPRPVATPQDVLDHMRPLMVSEAGRRLMGSDRMRPCTHAPGKHPDACDGEVESPPPVEPPCDCKYKRALLVVLADVEACRANPVSIGNHEDVEVLLRRFEDIARRALALGGESDNG